MCGTEKPEATVDRQFLQVFDHGKLSVGQMMEESDGSLVHPLAPDGELYIALYGGV